MEPVLRMSKKASPSRGLHRLPTGQPRGGLSRIHAGGPACCSAALLFCGSAVLLFCCSAPAPEGLPIRPAFCLLVTLAVESDPQKKADLVGQTVRVCHQRRGFRFPGTAFPERFSRSQVCKSGLFGSPSAHMGKIADGFDLRTIVFHTGNLFSTSAGPKDQKLARLTPAIVESLSQSSCPDNRSPRAY
ncbi:hypothetical protein N7468_001298 [Penicillium chermesinum]|uniref:Uncharacterized protein n=1 Tax=Penicillium chermesinum TaxID=63820 RepID=A0A9W9PGH6_9EURO|nr:uncharacterized protein N7468_001298 [Penicillium chermesinum]KAJ5246315.1 hypothetical protein N7468_001298 [Penicillium chermesinum]